MLTPRLFARTAQFTGPVLIMVVVPEPPEVPELEVVVVVVVVVVPTIEPPVVLVLVTPP
jgi:hypothetical protein